MQPQPPTARSEFFYGAHKVVPASVATAAWGLVTGVAMLKAGLAIGQAVGMTLIVFAGSAQLAAAPLVVAGASIAVVLVTAFIINLRFVIYAAALAPHFRGLSRARKIGLGYLSGDISFVVFMQRVESEPGRPYATAFLTGAAGANWLIWQVSSLVGIFLASFIPMAWGLGFAGTLALAALAIPLLRSRAAAAGALTTACVALATGDWPLKLGLLAATAAGIAAALLTEKLIEYTGRQGRLSESSRDE